MPGPVPHRLQTAYLRVQAVSRRTIVESRAIDRADREMLTAAGFLRPMLRGWFVLAELDRGIPVPPNPVEDLHRFLAIYLEDRCGEHWCLCPLTSLQILLEPTVLPAKVIVHAGGGGATTSRLASTTELIVYPDPGAIPLEVEIHRGIRLLAPEAALGKIRGRQWQDHRPLLTRAVLAVRDWSELGRYLAEKGLVTAAGHIQALLQEAGKTRLAAELGETLARAGYILRHRTPASPQGRKATGPGPDSLSAALEGWTESLSAHYPRDPVARPPLVPHLAATVDLLVDDTWHSLRLAGLDVDRDFVQELSDRHRYTAQQPDLWPAPDPVGRIIRGETYSTLPGDIDPIVLVSVQGHLAALEKTRGIILDLMQGPAPDLTLDPLKKLYLALMRPWAQAGLMPVRQLRRFRSSTTPAFPIGWTPPSPEAIPSCLGILEEWLTARSSDPAVRAAATHLALLWIQPWTRGNGRMARLVQNFLQAGAGQPWQSIPGDRRTDYLQAVSSALHSGDCRDFSTLFRG